MAKRALTQLCAATLCLQLASPAAQAEMNHDEKVAAAAALLGLAAILHNRHHYKDGYVPATGTHTADFETCYRDGLHGYPYTESSRDCAEGWQAGNSEREKSVAHRATVASDRAPAMALQGCAQIMAQNFAVGTHSVHFVKSRSPAKHVWEIEASVGHEHLVCKMRDSGEVIELRGGRL